ncbi:hypothetical protein [Lacticaseibacillus pantheris]|jgi:hypothetical protein|uniref:Uncharacterized protein n=1 Tax=Lacticaseibacillus pantheris DSM 15945 = JCM 12539 = NBRC 106106 TaxID=1423783 RepID=A0A0R1TSP4_9LACO|nr:hypothetical protein [Lacticaseibacillus pantheris]KRL84383.1 hypothetical protein FC50_GL002232 [Lacticaseibacillus pantheris DSM 15945 = JCM 12539 = NBRC 106106]
MLFNTRKIKATKLNPIFDRPGVYFVSQSTLTAAFSTFHQYVRALNDAGWAKRAGVIAAESSLVPYLPVRSNLFLNGNEHNLNVLPRQMRNSSFLNQQSSELHGIDILIVQLFREILAGKQIIVTGTVLDRLSGPEIRAFLSVAKAACTEQAVSLIIITTNADLAATAGHSLTEAPEIMVTNRLKQGSPT